jgi:phenylacetate-CoA ligase
MERQGADTMWNWRRAGFFALDHLRGRRFQWHLDDLAAYFADPVAYQPVAESRLQEFLDHATLTTEAFAPFRGATSLQDFPILTKQQIALDRRAHTSSAYDTGRLRVTTTSGSYGTPFSFPQTDEKWIRQRAEIIFFGRWVGFELGERHGYGLLVGGEKSRLTRFLQNEEWYDPIDLSVERLTEHCERLIRHRVRACIANPTYIQALARHSVASGIPPDAYSLRIIISTAEALNESQRTAAEMAFGCPFRGRYATAETSVMAQECLERKSYHLNLSSNIVELLSIDSDAPAAPGEIGRLVVTDVYTHAMPLIRYETGDLAIAGQGCSCGLPGPVLSSLVGRTFDTIYDPCGNAIYAVAIPVAMSEIEDVVQFQFVQRGANDYVLRLRVLPSFSGNGAVMARLLSLLGEGANIAIEFVDGISPLPSGKRPHVINDWNGNGRAGHAPTSRSAS